MIGNRHYILAAVSLGAAIGLAWFGKLNADYVSAIGVVLGCHFGATVAAGWKNGNVGSGK